jgi:hypothetical protein
MPYLPSCMQERDRTESREGFVRRGGYPSLLLTRHMGSSHGTQASVSKPDPNHTDGQ